jgi:hypothetical protein
MKGEPLLSVVIPWHNRFELERTLAENGRILAAHNLEILVVNCGGETSWLSLRLKGLSLPRLCRIEVPTGHFNKSLALNLGTFVSHAPNLFFLDADIILKEDFIAKAIDTLSCSCFVTVDRVYESMTQASREPQFLKTLVYTIELADRRGRLVRLETNRLHLDDRSRGAPGLILLRKQDFLDVGGMNADLERWGWEDLDLLARLQLSLGLERRSMGSVVHLSHGDDVRNLGTMTRAISEAHNFSQCLASYCIGYFQGTYLEDVKTWQNRIGICEVRSATES